MFNYNKFSYTIYTINPQIKNSIKKNMTAAFLPAILVPLVGLVFPALSMALFFIYVSVDDIN